MALTIDSILKLPPSKRAVLLIIIVVLIVGLYINFFYIPQREELQGLKSELSKLVKEMNESKAITRDLPKFREQINKLNEEFTNALTQLPNEKEIPEILKNISILGKQSNLEFTLFKPKPEEPQEFYAKVPIELTLLGRYHDTLVFFDKVSKLPRIINVININMARVKDIKGMEQSEIFVRTSCLVNTYRFIEKKSEEKKGEKKVAPKETEEEDLTKVKKK